MYSSYAQQLTLLLQSYSLLDIIDFPTRKTRLSSSAIDNIFIDNSRIHSFQVFSLINLTFKLFVVCNTQMLSERCCWNLLSSVKLAHLVLTAFSSSSKNRTQNFPFQSRFELSWSNSFFLSFFLDFTLIKCINQTL